MEQRFDVAEFYAHFKLMENTYWENVMYLQLVLHATSNLI